MKRKIILKRKIIFFLISLVTLFIIYSKSIPNVKAMDSILFGGYYDLLNPTTTEYNMVSGGYEWTITEINRIGAISTEGILKNLMVKLSGSPSSGTNYNFSIRVNGDDSVSVVISDDEIEGSNFIDTVSIKEGDIISMECDPYNTPDAVYATWSCMFDSEYDNESLVMQGSGWGLSSTETEYHNVMGSSSGGVTETDYRNVIPTNGTLTNMIVILNYDAGKDGTDGYEFTLRLNGMDTALSFTIIAPDIINTDHDNVSVFEGDIVTYKVVPIDSPTSTPPAHFGLTFRADEDNESIIMGGTINNYDTTLTEYIEVTPSYYAGLWTINENERYKIGGNCTIKKLYILTQYAPDEGNKLDYTLRIGGVDSDVTVTISDTDNIGNSGELSDILYDFEYITFQVDPDSEPTLGDSFWGFVIDTSPIVIFLPPSMPSLLYGAGFNRSLGYGFVELYWVNGTLVDDYEIQNSTDTIVWDMLGISNNTFYNDTSIELLNGTYRYYRVRSRRLSDDGYVNSSWSNANLERVNFTISGLVDIPTGDNNASALILIIFLILVASALIYGVKKKR